MSSRSRDGLDDRARRCLQWRPQRGRNVQRDERLAIIRSLPKVELHRHLEGSLRLATMIELGRKYRLDLPLDNEPALRSLVSYQEGEPRTLVHFLTKFHADWYRSYADVERVASEAVRDAAAEGIVHLELRFSPEHFTRTSGLQIQGIMQAISEASRAAACEMDISLGLLVTFARERYDHGQWREVIDLAAGMADQGLRGVDLAGDEFHHPNQVFSDILQRAHDTKVLGVTVHAGEGTSARSVATAIELLGADRIGHGLQAKDDPEVVGLLASRQVALEMCPTSNYQTGCIDDLQAHPLPELDRAGVAVTLNADDPSIHRTTLNDDYDTAITRWRYGLDDLLRMERHAVQAAFLDPEPGQKLLERVEEGYRKSRHQGLF